MMKVHLLSELLLGLPWHPSLKYTQIVSDARLRNRSFDALQGHQGVQEFRQQRAWIVIELCQKQSWQLIGTSSPFLKQFANSYIAMTSSPLAAPPFILPDCSASSSTCPRKLALYQCKGSRKREGLCGMWWVIKVGTYLLLHLKLLPKGTWRLRLDWLDSPSHVYNVD